MASLASSTNAKYASDSAHAKSGPGARHYGINVLAVTDADNQLESKFGYQPEMPRHRSLFNILLMAIVIASVPYGLGTTLFYSLTNGGPVSVIWGWVLMSSIYVCVAVSLGEISSKFPVSGGVYYWSFMLSPPKWAPLLSWICGWVALIGNWIVTLSVNFGTTQLLLAAVNIYHEDYIATAWQTVLTSWAMTALVTIISIVGGKYLVHVDTFCIAWILAGTLATLITLSVKAEAGRHSAEYVFTYFNNDGTGWPAGWSFMLGLLQAAYCFSATGMMPSMAEEVKNPAMDIPRAIGFMGLAFLLPILFVMPDIPTVLASATGQPLPVLYKLATGSSGSAFGLFFIILFNGFVCGLACAQASSRCTWAFARDGAIPGSAWISRVNPRFKVPFNAYILSTVVQVLLTLVYFGSITAFNAFIGVAVISLGVSYAIPVYISFFRGRKAIFGSPYYAGKFGYFCNIVTMCWYAFAIPLFCFSTVTPTTRETMNYASVVFVGFTLISAGWYIIWGRANFRGPPISDIVEDIGEGPEVSHRAGVPTNAQ